MSMVDGKMLCDRCGTDVQSGDVWHCAIISRLDFETGHVENLHLCLRGEQGPDGKFSEVEGCAVEVLDAKALADYTKRKRADEKQARAERRGDGDSKRRGSRRSAAE